MRGLLGKCRVEFQKKTKTKIKEQGASEIFFKDYQDRIIY